MKNNSKLMLSSERGFTLVEIIVVVVIIGLLTSMFGGKVFSSADRVYADLTRNKMLEIQNTVNEFRLRYRRIPQSIQDLTSCTELTGSGCTPLITNSDDIKDAWGNEIKYSADGPKKYSLTSYGADGQSGGSGVDGDIVVVGP